MKKKSIVLFVSVALVLSLSVQGQQTGDCYVRSLKKPKFHVALASVGDSVVYDLSIKSKYQTDENLVQLSRHFKYKYCRTNTIILTFFDNKKDAREFSIIGIGKLLDTARAIYVVDRAAGKEKLV